MVVAVSTTIAVARTAARSSTVANARLAMGIALATTSLERGNPRLAARRRQGQGLPVWNAQLLGSPGETWVSRMLGEPGQSKEAGSEACGSILCTTSVTLRVTSQASASTARRWRATNPAKGTAVARITPTTKTTLLSPSRPRLASEPSAMYYLLKGSWPSQCPSRTRTPTTTATTVLSSEADNIVPCNDQTLSLSLSTESVNLRPQIN